MTSEEIRKVRITVLCHLKKAIENTKKLLEETRTLLQAQELIAGYIEAELKSS